MNFTIDSETFEVKIYVDSQEAPLIYQPEQPNGTPWDSKKQATDWAKKFIYDYQNPVIVEQPAE